MTIAMPITLLDPNTALIVIDLQNGIVALATALPIAEIIRRASDLADAFRSCDLPVILVNVTGRPPGRTEPGSYRTASPISCPNSDRSQATMSSRSRPPGRSPEPTSTPT